MTYQTAPLRQKLKAVASEAMLDAAERCMVRHGYQATTMQQIASDAGCAIGTFYLYFKSKEDLFHAIVERHGKVMFARIREAFEREQDPVQKIQAGIRQHLVYADRHRGVFRLFFEAMPMRYRMLEKSLTGQTKQQNDAYCTMEREAIATAQKQGRIRADVSPERLQQFMGDICLGLCEEFAATPKASVDEYMDLMWSFISGGIGLDNTGAQENQP